MVKQKEIYKCEICGNIVEVLYAGGGDLVCCGQNMGVLEEKSEDQGLEKHVPVVEKTTEGMTVNVGSIPHPMEENHYIHFVEVLDGDRTYRKYFKPGDKAVAKFCTSSGKVREFCNIHGLWVKE